MITNMLKISRDGVPHYVAPWYRDLSAHGKKLIGSSNNIMAPWGSRHSKSALTKVEYQHRYGDGSPAHADPAVREAVRQHAAEKAKAIVAYEAGHLQQQPERIAA